MYMSVFPSPTFSPSKAVMSSGGVAEPTFQVMMCTLLEKTGVALTHCTLISHTPFSDTAESWLFLISNVRLWTYSPALVNVY